jgi:hypothetical protein
MWVKGNKGVKENLHASIVQYNPHNFFCILRAILGNKCKKH